MIAGQALPDRRDLPGGTKQLSARRALETAGVEFIDENGGGAGVHLRKPRKSKPGTE